MRKKLLSNIKEAENSLRKAKEEYSKYIETLPKIERAKAILEDNKLPNSYYNCWGFDSHEEVWSFKDGLKIGACWEYYYTDIVGVTEEEFNLITNK